MKRIRKGFAKLLHSALGVVTLAAFITCGVFSLLLLSLVLASPAGPPLLVAVILLLIVSAIIGS